MILAITQRYEKFQNGDKIKERFYYSKYFKDIFEELNIILFPVSSVTQLDKVADICDGLLISGRNVDINPKYYNEKPIKETNLPNDYDGEDKLDFALIKAFHKMNKPILGICAGIQSINVYFGGSLYQDIPNHTSGIKTNIHSVNIEKESFLNKCYNTGKMDVNSFHHQSIKRVAKGFKVTATSDDGIIEAIECGNIIGLQWHQEKMKDLTFFKKYIELYF